MDKLHLYAKLNEVPPLPNIRDILIDHLQSYLPQITEEPERSSKVAYSITGLMATSYVQSLLPSDPIDEILTIAGELEINPDNAENLRQELIQKILQLTK